MASRENPRGGTRPGAGRRARLSQAQRLAVGLAFEDAWRATAQDKLAAKLGRWKRSAHLAAKQKAMLAKLASGDLSRKEVVAALSRHGDLTFGTRSRLYRAQALRPYGLKDELIAQAAKRFGISARMVKTA